MVFLERATMSSMRVACERRPNPQRCQGSPHTTRTYPLFHRMTRGRLVCSLRLTIPRNFRLPLGLLLMLLGCGPKYHHTTPRLPLGMTLVRPLFRRTTPRLPLGMTLVRPQYHHTTPRLPLGMI